MGNKTKDIETFLKKEWEEFYKKAFHSLEYNEYKKAMEEDVKRCEVCGIIYWDGCKKRCDCG